MKVSLREGSILSGDLENLVKAEERTCRDEALTSCGGASAAQVSRHIEISLER